MSKKLLFVVNPIAGKGAMRQNLLDCVDCFVKAGYDVTIHTTQQPLDAANIVRERGAAFDCVVCSGGDGTLNETVSGLMACPADIPLGYIPAGTVNDFASSLGIPRQPVEAASIIAEGRPQPIDIGQFQDRFFCYIAAFGAFTGVPYTTPQAQKNLLGRTAYLLEGIRVLPEIRPFSMRFTCDERVIEGDFIYGMVTNSTSVGGFRELTPRDVRMDDGLFELVLVRMPHTPTDWQQALSELRQPDCDAQFVVQCKAARIEVTGEDEIPWTLDGEYGGSLSEVRIQNKYHALRIMTRAGEEDTQP